jgi:2,3-bisphosphoglycerate-dependent phosphoglycerate mutase
MPPRLVLIRHGESRAGVAGVVGGPRGCRGLTERGRAQSERLRDRLARTAELRPSLLLTSILPRAIETAEIVARAFPDVTPIVQDCDYCELHPGECDGLTWEETTRRYPPPPVDDPDAVMSPGGESGRAFDRRVRAALTSLLDAHSDGTAVIFTHGGFITASLLYLLGLPGLPQTRSFRLDPTNTSITEFGDRQTDGRWTLERYNDVAHLSG